MKFVVLIDSSFHERFLCSMQCCLDSIKTRDQIGNIHWIVEKAREFQKNIDFCFIDYYKDFVWISQHTVENSPSDGNTRHLTCLLQNLYAGQEATVKTRHGTTNWHLTYMQSTPCETLGWNQDCWEKYQ